MFLFQNVIIIIFFFLKFIVVPCQPLFDTLVTTGTVPSAVTEQEGRDHRQEE